MLQFRGLKFCLLVLSGLFLTCSVFSNALVTEFLDFKDDQIIFLHFKIEKSDGTGTNRIQQVSQNRRSGKLKQPYQSGIKKQGSLACILVQANKEQSDTIWIDNPIEPVVEFTDESKALNQRQIKLRTASFFIRFQQKDFDRILIFENKQEGKLTELFNATL